MRGHALLSLAGALWLGACTGDSTGPSSVQVFVVRQEWLTPEVRPFLDVNGQFDFPDTWQTREGDMTPAHAMTVAVAWARWREHDLIRDALRLERGTDITFGDLVPCAVRRLFRSPVSRVANDSFQGLRNGVGSQWPVLLCTPQQVPVLVVFVAAQSAITTAPDGSLLFPPPVPGILGGSDLSTVIAIAPGEKPRLRGFPDGPTSSLFSAEEAVARTVEATGRRIAALPRNVGSVFFPPGCGHWEMVLESPVTVLREGTPVETDTLFAPSINCPVEFGFSLASPDRIGEELVIPMVGSSAEARITIELPVEFHPVTIPQA